MTEVNGVQVPDSGVQTQYIVDKVGGFMYIATISTSVVQRRLDEIDAQIADAEKQVQAATELADSLREAKASVSATVK